MPRYHHHRDEVMIVSGDDRYLDSYTNLLSDTGLPVPPLPQGVVERIYEPGKRHALHDAEGNVATDEAAAPRDWPIGDAVIAAIFDALIAQAQRRTAERIAALRAETEQKIAEIERAAAAEIEAIAARKPA